MLQIKWSRFGCHILWLMLQSPGILNISLFLHVLSHFCLQSLDSVKLPAFCGNQPKRSVMPKPSDYQRRY